MSFSDSVPLFPSIEDRPAKSVPGVLLLGGTVATQVAVIASAIMGWVWPFFGFALLSVLFDLVSHEMVAVRTLFARAQIGLTMRAILRELAFAILVARTGGLDEAQFALIAGLAAGIPLARGAAFFLTTPLQRRVRQPVISLNIDVPAEATRTHTPSLPTLRSLIVATVPILLAGCWGLSSGVWWPYIVLAGLYLLACVLLNARVAWFILTVRGNPSGRRQMKMVNKAVRKLRPEAILYFSGSKTSTYQLNMWLKTMERIGRPVLVVIREEVHLKHLADTTLPIVVIPRSVDLMDFRLPSVRVAFYVAHVGKNIHLLREPRMKHVFIGHGESDKVASINPFTKVCDEVWVAGPASRERWNRAKVGVREDTIMEVGRPQLGGITGPQARTDRPLSVLYAPTWEGWTDDPFVSSEPTMGPELVQWLLDRPNTRLIFKPHPLIGTVSAKARQTDDAIIQSIRHSPEHAELPDDLSQQAWDEVADKHLVVTGTSPSLYECFNQADVLIGDISSVVPDFLASGKPYLIPNPGDADHDVLRAELASTRGAYIIDSDSAGWEPLLADAESPDSLSAERASLRNYLLGPRFDDPVEPWQTALTNLIDRANAEWPNAAAEAAALEHE